MADRFTWEEGDLTPIALLDTPVDKFNPNHDDEGRFATARGTGYSLGTDKKWRTADGKEAPARHVARLKEIKASGGYHDIRLNPDEGHYLQAVGQDSKGRRKAWYRPGFADVGKEKKYKRLEAFNKARPSILKAIDSAIAKNAPGSTEHDTALALKLIDRTGFRPGSDKNTLAEKKAHGATTLDAKHVKIRGSQIEFTFTGKKGVAIHKVLNDSELARALAPRVKRGGRLFNTSAVELRDFLARQGSGEFLPKDFRTWNGTSKALELVKKMPAPTSAAAYKKAQKDVSTVVSQHLGNTPIMAFNSYINPRVWDHWGPPPRSSK